MVRLEDLKKSDIGRSVLHTPKGGQYREGTIDRYTTIVVYVNFGNNIDACIPSELRFL